MKPETRADAEAVLLAAYRRDPVLYCEQVLGVRTLTSQQKRIAQLVAAHRRVFVRSAHSVGKTFLAAALTLWHYDCFPRGITLTTAPTRPQVIDLLWRELRRLRRGRPGLSPVAPVLSDPRDPSHFAKGYTARDAAAFQGKHDANIFIIFDEATGVRQEFWAAADGMMAGGEARMLAICNPTTRASAAYQAEVSGEWEIVQITALDHPNVLAGLRGEPAPIIGAVTLEWVEEKIAKWCAPIDRAIADPALDVEWRGAWFRPSALFEARVLGRWPRQSDAAVWTADAIMLAERPRPEAEVVRGFPQIGCDVARFGDDHTSIVARRGDAAILHETHLGWDTQRTADRLEQIAYRAARDATCGISDVVLAIDDDGVGGGVTDRLRRKGLTVRGVHAGGTARDKNGYPNRRSELWFALAERSAEGRLDLSRLSPESMTLVRAQLQAPEWGLDLHDRRVVETKDVTKKRVGRSPDDADALNLAFTFRDDTVGIWTPAGTSIATRTVQPIAQHGDSAKHEAGSMPGNANANTSEMTAEAAEAPEFAGTPWQAEARRLCAPDATTLADGLRAIAFVRASINGTGRAVALVGDAGSRGSQARLYVRDQYADGTLGEWREFIRGLQA